LQSEQNQKAVTQDSTDTIDAKQVHTTKHNTSLMKELKNFLYRGAQPLSQILPGPFNTPNLIVGPRLWVHPCSENAGYACACMCNISHGVL